MSEKAKIFQEKKELIAKTIRRDKTDKVPFMFLADGYVPHYAGLNKTDITTYEQATDLNKKVYEDLQYDCAFYPYFPQNLMMNNEILGGGCHVLSEDFNKQISPSDVIIMEPEEYPKLINDPVNYLLETVFPRRYELLRNTNPEEKMNRILKVFGCQQEFFTYLQSCEDNELPIMINGGLFNPIDFIFGLLRDFTGIMRDIKRCPELLRDAGIAMVDEYLKLMPMIRPVDHKTIFIPMLLPAFLKPKDFEKVYWPSWKLLTEAIVKQGHNIAFMFEKKYEHLYDYLQELPNKGIVGIFEEDDLKIAKKKLGNTMAIAGGLSRNTLQHGTEEECITHVKSLIDELAPGGGYFIAPDTPLMFPNDGYPENIKAVANYINKINK